MRPLIPFLPRCSLNSHISCRFKRPAFLWNFFHRKSKAF
uniref:Uncharacterized protein n=1 Tax=Arundo donax TaxID=35708 RepID=A0A0A9A5S4_ARUDO